MDTVSEARAKRREAAARTGREYLEAVGVLPQDEEATGEEALDGAEDRVKPTVVECVMEPEVSHARPLRGR